MNFTWIFGVLGFISLACASSAPVSTGSGLKVVVLGDSHLVGPMGRRLDENLRANASIQSVETFAVCGARADAFYSPVQTSCGYFEKLADGTTSDVLKAVSPDMANWSKSKPDWVVINLGTNVALLPDWKVAAKEIRLLLDQVKSLGARCYWILPPSMAKFAKELPSLESFLVAEVSKDCEVFQSSKVTVYPAGIKDGIHYSSKKMTPAGQAWGDSVFAALKQLWAI
ncbi:MAG: SGNH/GDSL hydrolase family protein [Bdellovibrionales bacterium]|nr:SGNH/GDSL hydrolase family protein [Bdellovibrionales bacterium]